jgi:hypothetical protein
LLETSLELQTLVPLLSESWHVKQQGNEVSFDFTLKGSQATIAQNLGIVAAIGASAARRYITNSKTMEARSTRDSR